MGWDGMGCGWDGMGLTWDEARGDERDEVWVKWGRYGDGIGWDRVNMCCHFDGLKWGDL